MNIIESISPYKIVEDNNLYGIQNDNGEWLVPCDSTIIINKTSKDQGVSMWDEIGLVEIIKDHRLGFFTRNGIYIEPQYDDVLYLDGCMEVKRGPEYGIISYSDFTFKEVRFIDSSLWRNDYNVNLIEKVIYKIGNRWYKNIYAYTKKDTETLIGKDIQEEIAFDTAERHYLDDSSYEGIYIFKKDDKSAIFIVDEEYGLKEGIFKSDEFEPFKYDSIEIRYPEEGNFAYALVKENETWSVLKISRLPIPSIEIIHSGNKTYEEAVAQTGIACDLDFID